MFVSKLDAGGTKLVYSTYLGGGSRDTGRPEELDRDRSMDRDLEDEFDTESPRGSGLGQSGGSTTRWSVTPLPGAAGS